MFKLQQLSAIDRFVFLDSTSLNHSNSVFLMNFIWAISFSRSISSNFRLSSPGLIPCFRHTIGSFLARLGNSHRSRVSQSEPIVGVNPYHSLFQGAPCSSRWCGPDGRSTVGAGPRWIAENAESRGRDRDRSNKGAVFIGREIFFRLPARPVPSGPPLFGSRASGSVAARGTRGIGNCRAWSVVHRRCRRFK